MKYNSEQQESDPIMSAKILIVDDDPTILTALKKCLTLFGHTPITAQSAESALEILHTPDQNIDLIVTDLNLPNMTGLELAHEARSESPLIPILIITGYANIESAQQAIALGIYEYITKPIDLSKLGISIQKALEYRQLKLDNDTYQKDLERKVRDRTKKLKKANAQLQTEINEQKKLTEQLQEAEDVANIGCWQWNVADNSVFWSDSLYRLIGYHVNEIPPNFDFWKSRVLPSDLDQYDAFITQAYQGYTNIRSEYRFKRKDGALRYFFAKGRSQFDESGNVTNMIGIIMDITEQKQMQKQIETQRLNAAQADRLHVLGEMAASIAHELNQPLAAISMIAEGICLRQETGIEISQTQIHDYMTDELSLVDRMSDIINHMRVFARDTSEENPINFNVEQVINSVLKFVKTQLKSHGIQIEINIPPHLSPCKGWPQEMEQVLLNLITNARDALDAYSLTKHPNWKASLKIQVDLCKQENMIKIEISDNGPGIPEKLMDRIFDPFFTTKEVGKGTGLGLAISKSIIEKHRGKIEVKSVLEQGTRFVIHLPIVSNS